jgi:hypothetical protein
MAAGIVFGWATHASAQQQRIWSAPGLTGTVDEEDTSIYRFNDTGSVSIKGSVASGTLNIRYPVQTAPDLLIPQQGDCPEMRVLLRDTGAGARVIVRLMQLGSGLGQGLTSLGRIDSDALPLPTDPTQYRSARVCLNPSRGSEFLFDYAFFTYYVDVQLIKSTGSANPGLMTLQICPSQDACDP